MSSFSLLRSLSSDTQSTPPKRRINNRFSFHQKQQQNQNVKDPIEASASERDKKVKSNLNRRWSSLKQYQTTTLLNQSLATGNCSSSSMNTSPLNASNDATTQRGLNGAGDVKKKWEVIEHYRETLGGRETISSSLLAVSWAALNKNPFMIPSVSISERRAFEESFWAFNCLLYKAHWRRFHQVYLSSFKWDFMSLQRYLQLMEFCFRLYWEFSEWNKD